MERVAKWPLGYNPPKYPNKRLVSVAREAVHLLSEAVARASDKTWYSGGSGLLRLIVFQAILFVDSAELAIEGHKRGNNRGAFVLQRCLFEYLYRAVAFERGITDPELTWGALVHRIAEDERQAGGGVRSDVIENQYTEWKERQEAGRPPEPPFETILKKIFDVEQAEDQKYVYQRYRRPGIFAHGALGAVDDVFVPGTSFDTLADRAITIDPDAQLIAIACLAFHFSELFEKTCSLDIANDLTLLWSRIELLKTAHNARRMK